MCMASYLVRHRDSFTLYFCDLMLLEVLNYMLVCHHMEKLRNTGLVD
jgi:hypothetical protein